MVFALAPALAFVFLVELAAWGIDAVTGYRQSLLGVIAAIETHADPLRPTGELPWPDPVIPVRCQAPAGTPQVPWKLGGIELQDSVAELFDTPTDPDGLRQLGGRQVFVVGGSAAFGHPYPYDRVFPTLLGGHLATRGYLVLNAARVGWPSAGVADMVGRITERYTPDTVIIMCGNNEWIHWQPPHQPWGTDVDTDAWRTQAHSRALALLRFWSVRSAIASMDDVRAARRDFAVHRELSGLDYALEHPMERYVTFRGDEWLAAKDRFLAVFEANLRRMVRDVRAGGARAILVTIPFNYRLSPAWKHPQPESFLPEHRAAVRAAVAKSAAARDRQHWDECLRIADSALALDPYPAILHGLRADALRGLARFDEAEQAYAACREQMVGHLGARQSVNDRIRSVAAAEGAVLVDAARLFDVQQHARGGHFNADLVHDDSHPTLLGHRIIADALAELF